MSRRDTVTLRVRARNLMARGLRRAGAMLRGFARSARRMARNLAIGFAAATAAAVTFGVKAVQAYAKQQKAERELTAALNAHGEAGDDLLPIYMRIAGRIQDATGTADEFTLSIMAQMRQLGVAADQLEEAAKGHVALMHAGMGADTATRALSAAMQGNYSLLTRYIPAIREASDEQEKAAILQDFLTRNYEAAEEELGTLSGRWVEFKNNVDDAMKVIGEAITETGAIQGVLKRASQAVKGFGQSIRDWIDSEQFERMRDAIQDVVSAMARGTGEQRMELLKGMGAVVRDSFIVAGEAAVKVLTKAAPKIGELIGSAVRGIARDILPIAQGSDEYQRAARELGRQEMEGGGDYFRWYTREQSKAIKAQVRRNRMEERIGKIKEHHAKETENELSSTEKLNQSWKNLAATAESINEEQGERSSLEEEIKGTILDQVSIEKLKEKAAMAALKRRRKESDEADRQKKLADEKEKLEKRINKLIEKRGRLMGELAKIARIDEQIEKLEQKARDVMFRDVPENLEDRIQAFMERRQQKKDVKQANREVKEEWAELRDRIRDADRGAGPQVRAKARERFKELEMFRRALLEEKKAEREIKDLEEKRDEIQNDQLHELEGIHEKMKGVREDLDKNLKAAGE